MASPALLLCLSVLLSVAAAMPAPAGINGSPCLSDEQCRGTRACFYIPLESPTSFGPCGARDECYCGPLTVADLLCTSDADCAEPGEVCASFAALGMSGCVALEAVDTFPQLTRAGDEPAGPAPVQIPPVAGPDADFPLLSTEPPFDGGDAALFPAPSAQPFDELEIEGSPLPSEQPFDDLGAEISPLPTEPPFDDFDDDVSPAPAAGDDPLVSESDGAPADAQADDDDDDAEPSESPESDAACIGAHHLKHLSAEQLVFDKHVRAAVLCDDHGSCATPGHIVKFDGRPMMMQSYCARVGCKSAVQLVNSPKYARKLSVQSQSPRLLFTAFAARYGTAAEERVLGAAVRVGL